MSVNFAPSVACVLQFDSIDSDSKFPEFQDIENDVESLSRANDDRSGTIEWLSGPIPYSGRIGEELEVGLAFLANVEQYSEGDALEFLRHVESRRSVWPGCVDAYAFLSGIGASYVEKLLVVLYFGFP